MIEQVCAGTVHIFRADDDGDNVPEDRCICGAYSWGEMDRILETFQTLESMWGASA